MAYSDSDGSNSGSGALNPLDGSYLNGFRAGEAVDISFTKDIGMPTQDFSEFDKVVPDRDALYLGWTEPGEWVNYTVQVEKAGAYALDAQYTSNGEGRFELRVDGVPRGTVSLPTTHDDADPVAWRQWHHWNKLVGGLELDLAPGLHVVQDPVPGREHQPRLPRVPREVERVRAERKVLRPFNTVDRQAENSTLSCPQCRKFPSAHGSSDPCLDRLRHSFVKKRTIRYAA